MSLRIDIQHPYAHDLILQALDVVAAGYPIAEELKPVELIGHGRFTLDGHKLSYDPVLIMNMSFNELVDGMHHCFIVYYLQRVPKANVFRLNEYVQH